MQKIVLSLIVVFSFETVFAACFGGNFSQKGEYTVVSVEPAAIRCGSLMDRKSRDPRSLPLNECILTVTGVDGKKEPVRVLGSHSRCTLKPGQKVKLSLDTPCCEEISRRIDCDSGMTGPKYSAIYGTQLLCSVEKARYYEKPEQPSK